jgi:predicted phosphodiesterase
MRVLVISDIHGNLAALEAVASVSCDAVVCLGDLVGYGPHPGPVVQWVRENAALVIQGNHDRALAEHVAPGCREQFRTLAAATFPLGQRQLSPEEIAYLGSLPRQAVRVFDGVRYLLVHATPSDPLYRYVGADSAAWARELSGIVADVVLVGHTHIPFDLQVGHSRVVNPGSVGQPKDGDPRASCALIDDGQIELLRRAYPVERTAKALEESGIGRKEAATLSRILQQGGLQPLPNEALDQATTGR